MKRTEADVLTFAEINLDCIAMNEAALERDWAEARFRCHLVSARSAEAGFAGVNAAANWVEQQLGPRGSEPIGGYAEAMLDLADEIDALPFR